jgi:hypothetical protein
VCVCVCVCIRIYIHTYVYIDVLDCYAYVLLYSYFTQVIFFPVPYSCVSYIILMLQHIVVCLFLRTLTLFTLKLCVFYCAYVDGADVNNMIIMRERKDRKSTPRTRVLRIRHMPRSC